MQPAAMPPEARLTGRAGIVAKAPALFTTWLGSGTKTEVTHTIYDNAVVFTPIFTQENLRTRVAATYSDNDDIVLNGFTHATYYSYDIHGNVKSLAHLNSDLLSTSFAVNALSYIDYDYDLISGNVNEVIYQKGKPDEMRHKYEYDADNRVTNVLTSNNGGVSWKQDAKYYYYKHGPLARAEVGHNKAQGYDYAYTLQGWVKGVNSSALNSGFDPGKDAAPGTAYNSAIPNLHQYVGSDAAGYSLYYYTNGGKYDYKAIDQNKYSYTGGNSFDADPTAVTFMNSGANNDLYNGNICAMQTSIVKVNLGGPNASLYEPQPQLCTYKYDQLNRLQEMRAYNDIVNNSVVSNNNYVTVTSGNDIYHNAFTYDPNGNIETQKRYDDQAMLQDDLTYQYDLNTSALSKRSNKLYHVNDAGNNNPGDINDQGAFTAGNLINSSNNYSYDEIGNLVRDNAEEIADIDWTVYGKIEKIERLITSARPDLEFKYDAGGNRVIKIVKPKVSAGGGNYALDNPANFVYTYYVKDVSGNAMATYERTGNAQFKLLERSLYGSSRLGLEMLNTDYSNLVAVYKETDALGSSYTNNYLSGLKAYEFNNHLGNVLTTFSDRKLPVDANSDNLIDFNVADVLSSNDYYAFGSPMPGRQFNAGNYRYGFNGKENDNEVSGTGNQQDYGMRIYDPRINRFLSVDPVTKAFPFLTPYQFASNSPIVNIDFDGMEGYNAAGGEYVTSPASNCDGCVPITQAEYEYYKRLYEFDKLKGDADKWKDLPYMLIYKPEGHTNYGPGVYYRAPNKPLLTITIASKFKGGSYSEIENEEILDKELDEFIEKLKSYEEMPTIEITTHTGSTKTKLGRKTGSTDEVYNQESEIKNPDGSKEKGTVGELMDKRGKTIKQKLIERGIPEEKIKLKRGSHENDDKNRKAEISVQT